MFGRYPGSARAIAFTEERSAGGPRQDGRNATKHNVQVVETWPVGAPVRSAAASTEPKGSLHNQPRRRPSA